MGCDLFVYAHLFWLLSVLHIASLSIFNTSEAIYRIPVVYVNYVKIDWLFRVIKQESWFLYLHLGQQIKGTYHVLICWRKDDSYQDLNKLGFNVVLFFLLWHSCVTTIPVVEPVFLVAYPKPGSRQNLSRKSSVVTSLHYAMKKFYGD